MERTWHDVVGPPPVASKQTNGTTNGAAEHKPDTTLRSVIIIGGIIGGLEAGFILPPAGQDVQWMKDNWVDFNRRADAGDKEIKDMVAEIKERGLLDQDESKGLEAARKKLEEMLGWGDSA